MRKTQCPYLNLNFGCMQSHTAHSVLSFNAVQYICWKSQQSLPRIPPQKNIDIQHSLSSILPFSQMTHTVAKVHQIWHEQATEERRAARMTSNHQKSFLQQRKSATTALGGSEVRPGLYQQRLCTRYTTTVPGIVKLAPWDATNKPGLYQVNCTWHHHHHNNVRAVKYDQVWTFVQLGHRSGNPCKSR